jgi:hypothetical protein
MPISAYAQKLAPPTLPEGLIKWQGPASYTQVTAGNPPSGGDSFPSILLGVDEILAISFMGTYTGNFEVVPVRISAAKWALEWRALKTATIGGQSQTSGTEAAASTNLSAEYANLHIITRAA